MCEVGIQRPSSLSVNVIHNFKNFRLISTSNILQSASFTILYKSSKYFFRTEINSDSIIIPHCVAAKPQQHVQLDNLIQTRVTIHEYKNNNSLQKHKGVDQQVLQYGPFQLYVSQVTYSWVIADQHHDRLQVLW